LPTVRERRPAKYAKACPPAKVTRRGAHLVQPGTGSVGVALQEPLARNRNRCPIGNGTGSDWKDVTVTLHLPEGCSASKRGQGMMTVSNDAAERHYNQCVCHAGALPAGERTTVSFVFYMPLPRRAYQAKLTTSRHLFEAPLTDDALVAAHEITAPEIVSLALSTS
jgi:hypothetical protein